MRLPALLLASLLVVSAACDSAAAQSTSCSTGPRSLVAGTWNLTVGSDPFVLHLAGTDLALSGAWLLTSGSISSGRAQGDFASGVLRLDRFVTSSGSEGVQYMIDCVVAQDGNSGTGTAYGYSGQTFAVTMTRVPPPAP
jgi:hypothetical protein